MEKSSKELINELEKIIESFSDTTAKELIESVNNLQKNFKSSAEKFQKEERKKIQDLFNSFFEKSRLERSDKSWEAWSNTNQLQQLSSKVEEFSKRESLIGLVEDVQNAIEEWKKVGPRIGDKSFVFWNAFKESCDLAFKRCSERKKDIAKEVTELVTPFLNIEKIDSTAAKKLKLTQTIKKVKNLQKEWNGIGVLPKKLESDSRKIYQSKCHDFFSHLKDYYSNQDVEKENNFLLKSQLVTKAEKKVKNSKNHFETARELKELQQEWKSIGATPKVKGDELWTKFQKVCNEHFESLKNVKKENSEKKVGILKKLDQIEEEITSGKKFEHIMKNLKSIQGEWNSVGPGEIEIDKEHREKIQSFWDKINGEKNSSKLKKVKEFKEFRTIKGNILVELQGLLNNSPRETLENVLDLEKKWQDCGEAEPFWSDFANEHFFFFKDIIESENKESNENSISKKKDLVFQMSVLCRLICNDTDLPPIDREYMAAQIQVGQELKGKYFVQGNDKKTHKNILDFMKKIKMKWVKLRALPKEELKIWNDLVFYSAKIFKKITP